MSTEPTDADVSPGGLSEPISPELVLVSPDLRAAALAELMRLEESRERVLREENPARHRVAGAPADDAALDGDSRRLVPQLVLYAGWQALLGVLFGIAAFGALIALILVATLLR
jgi:hypothetical protein